MAGYSTLSRLHGKMRPRLTGLPYLADRATRLGGLPHLSCKHDQIKIRDYMERRVTPPRRVTSPTWGPPPPCKQDLSRLVYSSSMQCVWFCNQPCSQGLFPAREKTLGTRLVLQRDSRFVSRDCHATDVALTERLGSNCF